MHLSIILAIDQLNAQILFFNKFIIFLYMFRAADRFQGERNERAVEDFEGES